MYLFAVHGALLVSPVDFERLDVLSARNVRTPFVVRWLVFELHHAIRLRPCAVRLIRFVWLRFGLVPSPAAWCARRL